MGRGAGGVRGGKMFQGPIANEGTNGGAGAGVERGEEGGVGTGKEGDLD